MRLLAGAEGLEPSTKVLETHVLPLHHAPKCRTNYIIPCIRPTVNMEFGFCVEKRMDNAVTLWYNLVHGKGNC